MKIEGSYVNKKGDTVTVEITIPGSTANDIAIEPDGVLEFAADDTVTIDSGVNDSLDVCQQHSCTIALHAATYVSDLFTSEYKDGKVEVSVNGACVFSGWLEPRTLTQPFNDVYDDLSLQCVDSLSAMQYSNYKDVNNTTTYTAEAEKAVAGMKAEGVRRFVMLTGDNQNTARAIAEELGIDDYRAEVLPEDKAAFLLIGILKALALQLSVVLRDLEGAVALILHSHLYGVGLCIIGESCIGSCCLCYSVYEVFCGNAVACFVHHISEGVLDVIKG